MLQAGESAKLLIIGQAPGAKVHASGIPWNDASGVRLREWLRVSPEVFYDRESVAIIPMGFCYPGRGRGGDLPPRPECAPLWHGSLMNELASVKLTLLIGQYAQRYYLGLRRKPTLTETVAAFRDYLPDYIPLPHPSPRNTAWFQRNKWFGDELLPVLRDRVQQIFPDAATVNSEALGHSAQPAA